MREFRRGARLVRSAVNVPRGSPIQLLRFCGPRLKMVAHRFAIMFNPVVKSVISCSVLPFMAAPVSPVRFAPPQLKP
jgi:hypothetical protein